MELQLSKAICLFRAGLVHQRLLGILIGYSADLSTIGHCLSETPPPGNLEYDEYQGFRGLRPIMAEDVKADDWR